MSCLQTDAREDVPRCLTSTGCPGAHGGEGRHLPSEGRCEFTVWTRRRLSSGQRPHQAGTGHEGAVFQGAAGIPGASGHSCAEEGVTRWAAAKEGGSSHQALHKGLHSPRPPSSSAVHAHGRVPVLANEWITSHGEVHQALPGSLPEI